MFLVFDSPLYTNVEFSVYEEILDGVVADFNKNEDRETKINKLGTSWVNDSNFGFTFSKDLISEKRDEDIATLVAHLSEKILAAISKQIQKEVISRDTHPGLFAISGDIECLEYHILEDPGVIPFNGKKIDPVVNRRHHNHVYPSTSAIPLKGNTIEEVIKSTEFGIKNMRDAGIDGEGVKIFIVDSGINIQDKDKKNIDQYFRRGDPGTSFWDEHGNMIASIVNKIAPKAKLLDVQIVEEDLDSEPLTNAMDAYIKILKDPNLKKDTNPKIIVNAWGIGDPNFQIKRLDHLSTDSKVTKENYATDPNHPFNKKVEDLIQGGYIVLFAAGNCGIKGENCALSGEGQSIWGANGLEDVITVGAMTFEKSYQEQSSRGPAQINCHNKKGSDLLNCLDQNKDGYILKPEFCGFTNFNAYRAADTGTSASTAYVAGVCALLLGEKKDWKPAKGKNPISDSDRLKDALQKTTWHNQRNPPTPKPPLFTADNRIGHGLIHPCKAYENLTPKSICPKK